MSFLHGTGEAGRVGLSVHMRALSSRKSPEVFKSLGWEMADWLTTPVLSCASCCSQC